MNNADIATVSTEPTPLCGLETTTYSSSPKQLSGERVLHLLAALVLCPLLVGVADAADTAVDPFESRAANEQKVTRFVFGAVADPLQAEETVALAKLKARRKPGEALIVGGLDERASRKLQFAYSEALRRVSERENCRALFADLGADGIEMLSTTVYRPAATGKQLQICRSTDAPAFTVTGQPNTRVCKSFARLSKHQATMVLIHEALHYAGLGEWPVDPDGMTPWEINRMVLRACDL
jgi:hypothetical protein